MKAKFNIKNYSTEVPAIRSIAQIEELLTLFGAEAIIKEFTSDGKVQRLSFKIEGKVFKLPANMNGVKKILYSGRRGYYGRDSMKKRDDKAYRITWRILKDWVHVQLSLILSGQAHPQEIFLPYMYDGKRTLYQKFVEEGKLLPQKSESGDKNG